MPKDVKDKKASRSIFGSLLYYSILAAIVALVVYFYIDSTEVIVKEGVVLVTGTSSGIGRNTAFYLAGKGFHTFATVRKEEDLNELKKEAKKRGLKSLIPIIADVTNQTQVDASVKAVEDYISKNPGLELVGLVNNAGMSSRLPCEFLDINFASMLYEINVYGVMRMCKAFIPLLRKSSTSTIVQISSILGIVTLPYTSLYSSSKFAVEAYSDALRAELHRMNIRVVSVQPGYVKTEIVKKAKKAMETHGLLNRTDAHNYPKFNYYTINDEDRPVIPVEETILHAIQIKRPFPAYITASPKEKIPAIIFTLLPKWINDLVRNNWV